MSRSIVHRLILPSCKLVIVALIVNAGIAAVAALLSSLNYLLRIFLYVSLFEAAFMMIVGPAMLFRSQEVIENAGSKILLAGILLFMLTAVASLAQVW